MAVSLLDANGTQIGSTQDVGAGKSVKFDSDHGYAGYNWTARNPYVTGSVHAIKYVQLGSVVLYDKTTGDTLKEVQYKNNESDPASAQLPYSYDKLNDLLSDEGYVLDPEFKESDYELANGQYSQDLRIPYVKQIKVTYSGSDSKTYDGKPAAINVTDVAWTGLTDLKTSTLTADDFTWNTADHKAPTAAGNYTLSLNANGEAALRAANKNYKIQKISGSYSYTIKPAEVDKDGHKIPTAPTPQYKNDQTPQYKNDPTQDTSVTYHPVKKPGNKSHNHSGNKGKISSKTVAHKTQTLTIVATANKSEKAQSNSTAKVEKSTSTNDKETLPQTGEKNENEAGIFGLAIAAIGSLFGLAAGKKRRKKEN